MIDYIKGELAELTPAQAVVEAYGVGYALNISLNTYEAVQGKKDVKLYVHESLVTGGRDDSYTFFGFASKQERDLYRLLITVSGVGANTARMILSAASPAELAGAISSGNERLLKGVKGIGLKTAQRCRQHHPRRRQGRGSGSAHNARLLTGSDSQGGDSPAYGRPDSACGTGGEDGAEADQVRQ